MEETGGQGTVAQESRSKNGHKDDQNMTKTEDLSDQNLDSSDGIQSSAESADPDRVVDNRPRADVTAERSPRAGQPCDVTEAAADSATNQVESQSVVCDKNNPAGLGAAEVTDHCTSAEVDQLMDSPVGQATLTDQVRPRDQPFPPLHSQWINPV